MAELPKIISVDDHVVEPAHLFERWLPAKFRDAGPHVERRGIGVMKHIGGGVYEQSFDESGPQGRLLGLRGSRLHQQAPRGRGRLRPRRHDDVADHLRRDAPRVLRPEGPDRRHGDELGRVVAVLPHVPSLLRADLPRGEGPRARRGVRARVQRLDGRGVVRRQRRPAHPADAHPAVGRRPRGSRGAAQRGARRARGVLQRDPAQARAAVDPLRRVGPVLHRVPGDEHGGVHAHRFVVADAGDFGRRARRGRGHVELQQRDGVALRLPVLGQARAVPRP